MALVPALVAYPHETEIRLAVFGDWGCGGERQRVLKGALEQYASAEGFHAGLLLGDNFYPDGVSSVDDPLWEDRFESGLATEPLGRTRWFAVLGDHDYRGNTAAQIHYTAISRGGWSMPTHFYRVDFVAAGQAPVLTLLAIDTHKKCSRWRQQVQWLESQLKALAGSRRHVVVMGHNPAVSYSRHGGQKQVNDRIVPLLERYDVALYLCGDDHNMQMIQRNNANYAVVGSACQQLYRVHDGPGQLFGQKKQGFAVLRVTAERLGLEFRDTEGNVLYTWDHGEPGTKSPDHQQ